MSFKESLQAFIPKSLLPLLKRGEKYAVLKGTILFADIAGFTKLTDNLSTIGKEGAEELTRILNLFFQKMIDVVIRSGGDILRFGGDAMTIYVPSSIEDAIKTSLLLKKESSHFNVVKSKVREISLSMKIGISYGEIFLGIVGSSVSGYEYFACGEPIDKSAEAEHLAQKGEIVFSEEILPFIKNDFLSVKKLKDGFYNIDKVLSYPSIKKEPNIEEEALNENILLNFLPEYIKEKSFTGYQKLVGEHRRTTILFINLSDFQMNSIDDFNRFNQLFLLISSIIKKYGGVVNKIDMGDKGNKIVSFFGTPYPLENQEEMGVRCAIELTTNPLIRDFSNYIKIGINVANVFSAFIGSSRRREYTVMGGGINLAARLMTSDLPDEIIVSKEIFEKTKNLFEFKTFKPIFVKGKDEKIEVFSPIGEKEDIQNYVSFVGRKKEVEKVYDALTSSNSTPFVGIFGGAGIGKTIFLIKMKELLEKEGIITIFLPVAPYDKEKFFTPIKNILFSLLGIARKEPLQIKEKLFQILDEEDKKYFFLFREIFNLEIEENGIQTPLNDKERKDIIFATVSRILFNYIESNRYCIIVDNLDFADPSTIEFFLSINEDLKETRCKILFSSRNIDSLSLSDLIKKSFVVELPPFNKEDVENVLTEIHNFAPPPEAFLDFLLKKSGGNPRFLGELISMIKNQNLAFIGSSQRFEVDEDKLYATQFPDTLQSLFLSKVECLDKEDKNILNCASILGTSFSLETLSLLTNKDIEALAEKIREMERLNLVRMDSWGKRLYATFCDNLLREALYDSLNYEIKRELHLLVANYLEGEATHSVRVFPVLARHYENGGEEEKALHYLLESAKYSKSIYDYRSSYEYLLRYVSLARKKNLSLKENKQFLEAYLMFGEVQKELGRLKEASLCLNEIISEITETTPIKIMAILKLADNKRREGDLKGSLELYDKALDGAKFLGDEGLQCKIFFYSGVPLAMLGRMGKAMDHFQRAELLAEKIKDYPSLVYSLMNRGLVEYFRGKYEGAKSFLLRAKEIAQDNNLRSYLAQIKANLATLFFYTGEYEKALEISKEAESVSRQFGYRNHLVMSMSNRAMSETMLGKWEEAEKSVDKAITLAKHYDMSYLIAANLHTKSLLLNVNGMLSESLSYQKDAFKIYLEINYIGEALGALGEILSISNQIRKPDLASFLIEENYGKLQKEIENSTSTLTISFNAHYTLYRFLTEKDDFYETEEKLENILERARESGILWLVAEVGSVVLKFNQLRDDHKKAVEIGEDLFPLLSTHFCPLIMPKFYINYGNSLLLVNKKDELESCLKALIEYDQFLQRGISGIEYNFLLFKAFEKENREESQKRLLIAKEITKSIINLEKDEIIIEAFKNIPYIKELMDI